MATRYDGVHRRMRDLRGAARSLSASISNDLHAEGTLVRDMSYHHPCKSTIATFLLERSTRQHASLNGSQSIDETHLSTVRVRFCKTTRICVIQLCSYTDMLGYLKLRGLYRLTYDSYRPGRLSKAVPAARKRTRVRRGNNRVAYSPVCHNSNISLGQAFRL